MKNLVLVGLIATQLTTGTTRAANLEACEPLISSMTANLTVIDKIFGLEKANQAALVFYSKTLAESKKVGLHAKAQELSNYRIASHRVHSLGQKSTAQLSDDELAEYLQLRKSTAPEREFQLQDQVKAGLAKVLNSLQPEITILTSKGYIFEIDERSSGTIHIKKQVADSKAVGYDTKGWSVAMCSHSKSHTEIVFRYSAGDTNYSKHMDRPGTEGCNNVSMGFALVSLSSFPMPKGCDATELDKAFSFTELK